ncbi:MAG: endonuclease/exonuclease/phosphatase family protein [Gemmatimonadetes bacterium]|nr:endonuclease/exonuclease/phosphatase family protein [Gemmatimonadota bacterium]
MARDGSGRFALGFAALALACSGALGPAGTGSGSVTGSRALDHAIPIRVVTYNIHAGKDAGGAPNLERVAAVLDSVAADIVLLQEVDRRTARSQDVDQLAELERLTGLHGVFGRTLDYQGGEYGIALLSRWPVAWDSVVPLAVEPPQPRAGGAVEPRAALHVRIATPGGLLDVINTHLDPLQAGTYRRQELVGLLAHVRRGVAGAAPVVVGGDLNTHPGTDEVAALELALVDGWVECGRGGGGGGATYPASVPERRIDYLFYRGAGCREASVVASAASDHRPLLLLLHIPREDR